MEKGILIAIGFEGFQVIGAVDSVAGAEELAREYITLGPENDWLAPERFEIHQRGIGGAYNRIEELSWKAVSA